MINEQELQEAVDKLWEGDDNGLLVKQDEVLNQMCGFDAAYVVEGTTSIESLFKNTARYLLIEAYEQEQVDKYLRDQEYSQNGM